MHYCMTMYVIQLLVIAEMVTYSMCVVYNTYVPTSVHTPHSTLYTHPYTNACAEANSICDLILENRRYPHNFHNAF